MTIDETKRTVIDVAARGWQAPEWDHFYPHDLPAEWRLDYYANEFFAVLVPYADWCGQDDDTLLEWQEQVSDEFRFYWELSAASGEDRSRLQQLRQHEAFEAHWGGVIEAGLHTTSIQAPFAGGRIAPLLVEQVQELRSMRQMLEQGLQGGADALLVIVEAQAAQGMRQLRDMVQLLGYG